MQCTTVHEDENRHWKLVCTLKSFLRFGVHEDESFGILRNDYATVRHDWKLKQLQDIMPALST